MNLTRFAACIVLPILSLLAPARAGAAATPEPLAILTPAQGRPVFCTPDKPFNCLLHLPRDLGSDPRIRLQNSLLPMLRYPVSVSGQPRAFGEGFIEARLQVPATAPPGLYDLVVAGPQREIVSRCCLRVVRDFPARFRFVHLSNMNIGDPTAAEFDPQIPEEVNLLDPAFIVATGDYTEWARLRDDPGDWPRVLDYMARFHAPVYMVCGDHDHEASFTKYVANSLIGTIDYGDYHGLLLLDHGAHPIERDDEQIEWILRDLEENKGKTLNFIVCHSDELGLIRRLRQRGLHEKIVKDYRVRMLICGGHSDWDYTEFASLLEGLSGLHYIRTGQASSAVRDKATGQSRYRVIEVTKDRLSYVYPTDDLDPSRQHSIVAGRIRTSFATANDGSADPVTVTITNSQNRPWEECRIWLRVRKDASGAEPAVAGGRLIRALDAGSSWACEVGFDLPDKGAVTLQAGSARRLVPALAVLLDLSGPEQLPFVERFAGFGLTYYTCGEPVSLKLTNTAGAAVRVYPVVRLNGTNLPLASAGALPLTLAPGATQAVRVNLTLGQLSPGPHVMQAYLLEDPLRRMATRPVIVLPAGATPAVESAGSRPASASQPSGAADGQQASPG